MPGSPQDRLNLPRDPLTRTLQIPAVSVEFAHALIFTGHMIDAPGRSFPRFPAWAEDRVRIAIQDEISKIEWEYPGPTVGLAAAASGGDLLFHETCEKLSIPTRILLALPIHLFCQASVAPAGPEWVRRFDALLERRGPRFVAEMEEDDGLLEGSTQDIWQRANLWMIEEARSLAQEQALLALWNGARGDGPGGTEHFLDAAAGFGIRILPPIRIDRLLTA